MPAGDDQHICALRNVMDIKKNPPNPRYTKGYVVKGFPTQSEKCAVAFIHPQRKPMRAQGLRIGPNDRRDRHPIF